jgi:hypothetical protein
MKRKPVCESETCFSTGSSEMCFFHDEKKHAEETNDAKSAHK